MLCSGFAPLLSTPLSDLLASLPGTAAAGRCLRPGAGATGLRPEAEPALSWLLAYVGCTNCEYRGFLHKLNLIALDSKANLY